MVSVTIVTWNSAKYLDECFAALARQDYREIEIIIVDNGSEDDTREVLKRADPRWRLEVCGDGPLADALAQRAAELGVADRLRQRGYVPIDGGLWDLYRAGHALLHISMTEGVPQVILEAFAARLPVVATDVGGVGDLVGDRGLLVAPRDPDGAAAALARLVTDAPLRERLVAAAQREAADHTLEAECSRLAGFMSMNS